MAGIDWGQAAGGAQEGLQALIERQILAEKMALAERQQAAEEQWRQAQLAEQAAGRVQQGGQFDRTLGQRQTEWGDQAPEREAGVALTRAQTGGQVLKNVGEGLDTTEKARIFRARPAAEQRIDERPGGQAVLDTRLAGVTSKGVDPTDMTGAVEQQRGLQRIGAASAGSIAAAKAARDNRTVTIKTVDEAGNPVTKVVPISEALGEDFSAQPTAEMRNRGGAGKRAGAVVDRLETLSKRINVNKGLAATATGAANRAAAQVNYNNDVAEYERYLAANAPLLARAFGHTGVLTQMDEDSVTKAAPAPGDNDELASRLITGMRNTMAEMEGASGGKAPASAASAPAGGKQITLGNLRAKAQKLGMTEEAARADAEARGYTIVP